MITGSILDDDKKVISDTYASADMSIWAASMKGAVITYRGTIRDKSCLTQIENPQIGDLYIDPSVQESYMFTGSSWCDVPM